MTPIRTLRLKSMKQISIHQHRKVKFFINEYSYWIFFKGNLLYLPSNIAARSTVNEGNASVDNQRAIKQLEMSNKIQTGLELKIETLKKEIRTLIESFLFFIHRFSF